MIGCSYWVPALNDGGLNLNPPGLDSEVPLPDGGPN